MERVMDVIAPPPEARVLDVGCGKGEFLIRMVERLGARAVGIDPSPVLAMARENATERTKEQLVFFFCGRCARLLPESSF